MWRDLFAFILILTLFSSTLLSKPFSFAVMGDSRPPTEEQPYVFYKVLEKIKELEPDLVFSTGDVISGYTEDRKELIQMYEDFEELLKILGNIPVYIAPGNHDVVNIDSLQNEFTDRFGPTFKSISYENCYYILLNTDEPGQKRKIVDKQLEWLREELQKAQSFEHIFVFIHRPLYPKIKHIGMSLDYYPKERDELAKLFINSNVEMVFAGHVHIYNHTFVNGLHQIITGGAGAPLYADEPEEGGFYHFMHIFVDSSSVDYRIFPIESEIKEAETQIRNGYFERAVELSLKAIAYLPEHPEPYLPAILSYKLLEQDFPAYLMYVKLKEIVQSDFKAARRFAYFCYDKKFYKISEEYFLKAVEIDVTSLDSFYRLGRINEKTKNYPKAIVFFEKALFLTKDKNKTKRITEKIEKLKKFE